MRNFLTAVLFFLLASSCLAENPNPIKESTPTDQNDIAEVNNGTIQREQPPETMSHPCPYTCSDAGYSHGQCREWQDGNTCMIGPKLDSPQTDSK